jgi:type VI protein secretion system component Hcp
VPVQLAKGVDRASPLLMKASLTGTVFPQARLQAWGRSPGGDGTGVLREQWLFEGATVATRA